MFPGKPGSWRSLAILAGVALMVGLVIAGLVYRQGKEKRPQSPDGAVTPPAPNTSAHERRAAELVQQAASSQEPEALLQIGETLLEMGERQRAFDLIARAYDQKFKDPRFAAAMVEALLETGQAQDARALATPLVKQAPNSGDAHASLAEVMLQFGRYTQALELARKATQLQPESPRAWQAFARASAREKRLPEAWPAFEKAVKLAPEDGGLLADYGDELAFYGQPEKAEEVLRRALSLRPRDTRTLTLLGKHLGSQALTPARQAEAVALLRKAIELTPTASEPHLQLGRLLLQTGDTAGAMTALEECLRLDSSLLEAWLPLGQAYQAAGREQQAKDAFARYSRFAELRREMAQLQLRLRRNPDSVPTLLQLAALEEGYGRKQEALGHYRQALGLKPDPELSKYVAGLEKSVTASGSAPAPQSPTDPHSHPH